MAVGCSVSRGYKYRCHVIAGGCSCDSCGVFMYASIGHVIAVIVLRSKVVPFNLPDVGEAIQTVEVKEW